MDGQSFRRKDRKTEWHNIVVWDKLAEICNSYLAKAVWSISKGASRRASGTIRKATNEKRRKSVRGYGPAGWAAGWWRRRWIASRTLRNGSAQAVEGRCRYPITDDDIPFKDGIF
jgi:single-stranded DNA-binding protein